MSFWNTELENDNILSELHTDWVSEVSDAEMNEAETLDTDIATASSGKWLWLCPLVSAASDSELCNTDED